jgi:hypothetical protein
MGVRTVDCYYGPAAPLNYSSAGSGPSSHLLRASRASILFEYGLRSLESSSSGQQCLHIIRVRTLVPRIIFFGPAAPPNYSSVDSGPFNPLLWASSASELFECGLRSLESLSSGQQCFNIDLGADSSPWNPTLCLHLMPEFWWQYTSSDVVCQIRR